MVLLTMTSAMVAAIRRYEEVAGAELKKLLLHGEPLLEKPDVGNPISHEQVLGIAKALREHAAELDDSVHMGDQSSYRLNDLLRGSKVYVPPPKPKPEPTPEYKVLMERLRREEEARAYGRMLNPQMQPETFSQRFPASPHAHLFRTAADIAKEEEDEMTYADVNRQLMLMLNILVSVVACGVCIWLVARHWSTPSRLGLSMFGSIAVAIAEAGVYAVYIQRLKEAKKKEKAKLERKEILETWTIEPKKAGGKEKLIQAKSGNHAQGDSVRLRKGKPK